MALCALALAIFVWPSKYFVTENESFLKCWSECSCFGEGGLRNMEGG